MAQPPSYDGTTLERDLAADGKLTLQLKRDGQSRRQCRHQSQELASLNPPGCHCPAPARPKMAIAHAMSRSTEPVRSNHIRDGQIWWELRKALTLTMMISWARRSPEMMWQRILHTS